MTVRPLAHVNPVIRGVFWNLHRLVSEALADRLPPGWKLFPVFHTRISCFLDPATARNPADGEIIKDTTLDYVAIALYTPVGGKDSGRPAVPLIAIDLVEKAPQERPPPDLLHDVGLSYTVLTESAYEEAQSRIATALRGVDVVQVLSRRDTRDFLNVVERRLFWSLVHAAAGRNLIVLGQTSLPAMVDLSDDGPVVKALRESRVAPWKEMLRYLRRHPVDFVLCSGAPYGLPCILIALEGSAKNKANPALGRMKRAEQDAVVAASGLTLCRVNWDEKNYITHNADEMRDLAESLVSVTRQWIDSGDFTRVLRSRIAEPLKELTGTSARKKQIAEDVIAILQYQVTRISALESDNDALRDSMQHQERELESAFPPSESRSDDYLRDLGEMYLEELLTACRDEGRLPHWSDLGLTLHTWDAPDPIDGMPSIWAEIAWAAPPNEPAPPLPKSVCTPIKVEFTGAWQHECNTAYRSAAKRRLEKRLVKSLDRNASSLIKHRLALLTTEKQKRAEEEIASSIARLIALHKTPVQVQSALLSAIDRDVPLWTAPSLRLTLVGRWRRAVLKANLPDGTRDSLLERLAAIATAPQTAIPDRPNLGR